MPGIADQIRELVRSVTNLARRIRRLETLQAPLAVARPQGGHIIQDEGVDLTERVYLNFVGVRVEAVDDPENGATIITVSDPEGDDFCRVTPLDVGWQINVGIESRYMKHSTAFQLSSGGDTRGAYAIDLQQDRNNPNEVAGADYSIILGGDENRITGDAKYSSISGAKLNYLDDAYDCHVHGGYNELYNDCYSIHVSGENMDLDEVLYGFFQGLNHTIGTDTLGCFSFTEDNEIIPNANASPTYSGSIGIGLLLEGDVYLSYQMGESNEMVGAGITDSVLWCTQYGLHNYIGEQAQHVFQVGQELCSYLPAGLVGDFYNGRIMANGDNAQEYSSNTPENTGFNQNSWFNQSTAINNWTVAWISSRFQFPIIEDSIWSFTAYIAGTELGCANSYAWKIEGVVENDGGTTTILVSTVTNIYRDVPTKEWQVVADDPNDRLVFQFRDTNGPDATRCNIQFSMDTVEVGYEY